MRNDRAVFLDKDGTLIEDRPYKAGPATFLPGVIEALGLLKGFRLVVVTNQSGIAKGLMTEADLARQRQDIYQRLKAEGIHLDGFYHCPHTGGCACRKPEPGMLLQAASDLGLDLSRSWMVGDRDTDVEAGRRAGCRVRVVTDGLLPIARELSRDNG